MASDLHILYKLKQDAGPKADVASLVDLVAVHGLNETSAEAWTHSKTQVNWLVDLLPSDVVIARVLAFDYDASASAFFGEGAVDRIQTLSETFMAHLQAVRSFEDNCERRPIIFVCHGLGGILVKKVLAHASTKTAMDNIHYHSIFLSTYAILFFGTPHQSIDRERWIDLEKQQKFKFGGSLLALHRATSMASRHVDNLRVITDQFTPIVKNFRIFYLWEELPTDLGHTSQIIVDYTSAAPSDDRERSGIHATHADMIKFSSPQSAGYKVVLGALLRYCRDAPLKIERRWQIAVGELHRLRLNEANEIIGLPPEVGKTLSTESLQKTSTPPAKLNKYFYPPAENTVDFIGRDDDLLYLSDALFSVVEADMERQKRFVIHGLGGSGKTQLCCQFAREHRQKFWAIFTIRAATMETVKESFCRIGEMGGLAATESAGKYWLSQLEQPWLLIIDNADNPNLDLPAIFPAGSSGIVLITTRNPDFRRFGTSGSLRLEGLEKDEAVRLLLKRADVPLPWTSSTQTAGHNIAKALGYLALALVQAGTSIFRKICDLTDYLEFYSHHRNRYKARAKNLDQSSEDDDMVYSAFELSLTYLHSRDSEASRDAIEMLSIVAFCHFEHISIDIFVRAFNNRSASQTAYREGPVLAKLLYPLVRRVQAPAILPSFLKTGPDVGDKFRIRKALYELFSLSLISYDGKNETFSLHPLVHAWAKDRLGVGGRALWSQIALNTISEAILLPPADVGDIHGRFRTDLLPHLDACLTACPPTFPHLNSRLGLFQLSTAIFLQPTLFFLIKDKVVTTAKCGYVYAERGRFDQAADCLKKVKDVLVATLGVKNEKTMKAILGLAGTLWGLGRLDEAIELQTVVVDARTKVLGCRHVDTLLAQDQLGRSYWLNGQYTEALAVQQPTSKAMENTLGPDDNRTLDALDNLGVTLGAWHRWEESYRLHQSVWDARERKKEKDRLLILTTASNTAMALFDLDRLDEASRIMEMVYEERKERLGKEHPWTLWALCYLAKIQTKLKNYETAEKMLIEGIAAGIRSLNETHLGVLMGYGELARIYFYQNRFEEAETLCLQTLERLENSRGAEHPDSVYARWKLGHLYARQKRTTEAIDEYQTALERAVSRLTSRHPLYQKIESELDELIQGHADKLRTNSAGLQMEDEASLINKSTATAPREESRPRAAELLKRNVKPRTHVTW